MAKLSQRLADLSVHAKNAEDAVEAAEKEAELLLLRYLSRHSAGRVQLSLIYLTTHLSIVMRRQPRFEHLSKQKVHNILCRLVASQLSLFYP